MNFILSLAHFCEVHGPTSILCTQALPPECPTCELPSNADSAPLESTILNPSLAAVSQGKTIESANVTRTNINAAQALNPRLAAGGTCTGALPQLSNPSSCLSSPTDTPPQSPRSPNTATSSSLPSSVSAHGLNTHPTSTPITGGSNSSDTCKNCCLSLPKSISDKIKEASGPDPQKLDDKYIKLHPPMLRTKESVPVYIASEWQGDMVEHVLHKSSDSKAQKQVHFQDSSNDGDYSSSPFTIIQKSCSSSSSFSDPDGDDLEPSNAGTETLPLHLSGIHTHDVVYLSSRAPTTPTVFYTVRQACVQTLSCELLPTHTGAMFFGNPVIGYTIAYVFRLADPKARGGRRPYALLCICPDEQASIRSWNYVVRTFEGLVQRIKGFAALKNAKEKAVAATSSSANRTTTSVPGRLGGITAPDGFLRRREGVGSAKGLAELVGKEDLFVEVHATFARLLGGLGRRFGYWTAANEAILLKSEKGEENTASAEKARSRSAVRTREVKDTRGRTQRSHSTDGTVGSKEISTEILTSTTIRGMT